jgi:hypothetical protein
MVTACFQDFGLVGIETEEAAPPATILDATYEDIGYDETVDTCFRMPAQGRGTGYAAHPELALGSIWWPDPECITTNCVWAPTSDIYDGFARNENNDRVGTFEGFTMFDGTRSTMMLSEIFGARLESDTPARVTVDRVYAGYVDYSQRNVQAWLADWEQANPFFGRAGFAWDVQVVEWRAEVFEQSFGDEETDDLVQIDGLTWVPSGNELLGFEVFVCVVDIP